MKNRNSLTSGQIKGYLFEVVVMELLRKNQFSEINVSAEPNDRVYEIRPGFVELKGRGCWHQIDCPCDYNRLIPFSYPLRLLGEVKFYKKHLSKEHIRRYIGVIKDIQENYFVTDGANAGDLYPRKLEIGVYFSANGFQEEAEKLAYAHGIKTISYKNNYLINRLKDLVEELERDYLSGLSWNDSDWSVFRQDFIEVIRHGYSDNRNKYHPYLADGCGGIIEKIRNSLMSIKSSFIATTATGVFLHFVGDSDFPDELFRESDEGRCQIYYDMDDSGKRYFWMEISGDDSLRRFYFTPPESLNFASVFGAQDVLNEKERIFRDLNVNIQIKGISRSLILHLDQDWLEAIRNTNHLNN